MIQGYKLNRLKWPQFHRLAVRYEPQRWMISNMLGFALLTTSLPELNDRGGIGSHD